MKKLIKGVILGFGVVTTAFSQVQMFEQEVSGIHPYFGLQYNEKISQAHLGFEYNIDGRVSLGFRAGKAAKDSITMDKDMKQYFFNPYVMFEFIEPGNLSFFSFAMRGDAILEDVSKTATNPNEFTRTGYGLGPVFSFRFQSNERWSFVPEFSYQLYFQTWRMYRLHADNKTFDDNSDNGLMHNLSAGLQVIYHMTDRYGFSVIPRVVAKTGNGLTSSDLVNVDVSFGYFLSL